MTPPKIHRSEPKASEREWIREAMQRISADFQRSADTHLVKVDLPGHRGIDFYLKDESTHPSGSLKHRLSRSLFLYGLCNGLISEGMPIIEASSGSTAISEAYFARLLGLPFIAVIPEGTAKRKIEQIHFYGGECREVAPEVIETEAHRLAKEIGGHDMDQFTFAERATDWRGNNNIADSLFTQLSREPHPVPKWVVVSAGTGGTSATIGRFIRYKPELYGETRLAVVDPENSVFFDYYRTRDPELRSSCGSRIEGIGRPLVEPSFLPQVIDTMVRVPDAASIATIWWLEDLLGRKCGGSTGTNVYGALQLISRLEERDEEGSVVSLICDAGDRYLDTYYDRGWLEEHGLDIDPYLDQLRAYERTGKLDPVPS